MYEVEVFHTNTVGHGPHDCANDKHVQDGANNGMKQDRPKMLHNIVVVDGIACLKNDPWQDEEEELLAVEPKIICSMYMRVVNDSGCKLKAGMPRSFLSANVCMCVFVVSLSHSFSFCW